MTSPPTSPSKAEGAVELAFERRAERAALLAHEPGSAQAVLRFASGLYRAQAGLAGLIVRAHGRRALGGAWAQDADAFAEAARDVLRFAADSGPAELAETARARLRELPEGLAARLSQFWNGEGAGAGDYLSRAVVRPYVEVLAALKVQPQRPRSPSSCPFCGGAPWIAARRAAADGEGAQRYLGCALCGGEWVANRIRCSACSEEDPRKLPCFQSEQHAAVRIEACESCHHYVKSIDLTVDARLIPEVDDLVSLALDLWAHEAGFTRTEPGLAGL
ncbi:MAG TPA: formate dehydrogenase accessory protein FdhE [Polyangia bacterium]|nr:formate dehydrogenase accessory protein FdhE [Polyangia bacterium]